MARAYHGGFWKLAHQFRRPPLFLALLLAILYFVFQTVNSIPYEKSKYGTALEKIELQK